MSLKSQGGVKHQVGDWYDCDGWVGLSEALGDRCEMRDGDLTAVFVYVENDVVANLITDIFRWDTIFNKHVDVTTDASNWIAGLHTGTTVQGGTGYRGWLQCGGQKLATVTFAGLAICNNLLGDGSVATGEDMMPHASTDGMVDTYSGVLNAAIGTAGEDDAPAITLYNLFCRSSMAA